MAETEKFLNLYDHEVSKSGLPSDDRLREVLKKEFSILLAEVGNLKSNTFTDTCDEETLGLQYSLISRRAFTGSSDYKRKYLMLRRKTKLSPYEAGRALILDIAGIKGEITSDGKLYIFSPVNISLSESIARVKSLLPVYSQPVIITEGECWGFLDAKGLNWNEIESILEEKDGFD